MKTRTAFYASKSKSKRKIQSKRIMSLHFSRNCRLQSIRRLKTRTLTKNRRARSRQRRRGGASVGLAVGLGLGIPAAAVGTSYMYKSFKEQDDDESWTKKVGSQQLPSNASTEETTPATEKLEENKKEDAAEDEKEKPVQKKEDLPVEDPKEEDKKEDAAEVEKEEPVQKKEDLPVEDPKEEDNKEDAAEDEKEGPVQKKEDLPVEDPKEEDKKDKTVQTSQTNPVDLPEPTSTKMLTKDKMPDPVPELPPPPPTPKEIVLEKKVLQLLSDPTWTTVRAGIENNTISNSTMNTVFGEKTAESTYLRDNNFKTLITENKFEFSFTSDPSVSFGAIKNKDQSFYTFTSSNVRFSDTVLQIVSRLHLKEMFISNVKKDKETPSEICEVKVKVIDDIIRVLAVHRKEFKINDHPKSLQKMIDFLLLEREDLMFHFRYFRSSNATTA